jgi:hypothetical protein
MSEPILSPQPKPAEDRSGVERRTSVRYSLDVPAAFCHPVAEVANDDCWVAARVHDISRSGLGLMLTHDVDTGKLLALDLEGIPRLLLAHVVHATAQDDRSWLVGCELVNGLSDEELQRVLAD